MSDLNYDQAGRKELPTVSTQQLASLRLQEPVAWSRLVEAFGPVVYRWCRTSGVAAQDAADIVQEVFTSVAQRIGQFERHRAERSFRAWLATITRSKVCDLWRSRSKNTCATGGTEGLQRLQNQPDDFGSSITTASADTILVRRALQQVRSTVDANTWSAFEQYVLEAKSVSEATGLSPTSVYQAKTRILQKLRSHLGSLPN